MTWVSKQGITGNEMAVSAHLSRFLFKPYAYAFYVLRRSAKWVWDDGWDEWKAILFVSLAMFFGALALTNVLSISIHVRIALAMYQRKPIAIFWVMFGIGLFWINSYLLTADRRGRRFDGEFAHYTRFTRILAGVTVWAVFFLIIAMAFWTSSVARKLLGP